MGDTTKPEDEFDPSLPLDDPGEEAFVLSYLKNKRNATKAYQECNPDVTYDSARVLGCKKLANVNIRARIRTLEQQALFASGFREEVLVEQLLKFGLLGSLRHFVKANTQGDPVFDFSEALKNEDVMDTLSELSIDSYYDQGLEKMVKTIKLKLEPRQEAIKTLATMQGMFAKDNAQKAAASQLPPIIVQTGIEAPPNNVPAQLPTPEDDKPGN